MAGPGAGGRRRADDGDRSIGRVQEMHGLNMVVSVKH